MSKLKKWLYVLLIASLTPLVIYAASLTKKHTFSGGEVISSSQVNENFDQLFETAARKNPNSGGVQFTENVDVAGLTVNGSAIGTSTSSYWSEASGDLSYTGGNVGVGIGTATTPFHVVGATTLVGDVGLTGNLNVTGGTISGTFAGTVPAANITGLAASAWEKTGNGLHYNDGGITTLNIGIGIADDENIRLLIRARDASNSKYGLKVTDSNSVNLFYVRNDGRSGIGGDGSEKFVITESGSLGLGVTSPTTTIHAKPSSGDASLLLETSSDANFASVQVKGGPTSQTWSMGTQQDNLSNSLVFRNGAAGTERMVIDTSGNMGVGVNDPLASLHVSGGIRASNNPSTNEYVQIAHGGNNGFIDLVGDGDLQFRFGGSTKAYITPDGNAGFDGGGDFGGDVEGRIKVPYRGGTGGTANEFANSAHRQISHSGYDLWIWKDGDGWVQMTSYGTHGASDKRWKQNIQKVDNALNKIIGLNGVNFEYKTSALKEYNFREGKQAGFIAQEVEKVIPELVYTKSGFKDYKFIDYDKMTSYLAQAIKELKNAKDQEISDLKNENAQLTERLNSIEHRLAALGI